MLSTFKAVDVCFVCNFVLVAFNFIVATYTLQVAFNPFDVVAVIVAFPPDLAVTTPLASTVATLLSLDAKDTDKSLAFAGAIFAIS